MTPPLRCATVCNLPTNCAGRCSRSSFCRLPQHTRPSSSAQPPALLDSGGPEPVASREIVRFRFPAVIDGRPAFNPAPGRGKLLVWTTGIEKPRFLPVGGGSWGAPRGPPAEVAFVGAGDLGPECGPPDHRRPALLLFRACVRPRRRLRDHRPALPQEHRPRTSARDPPPAPLFVSLVEV